MAWVVREWHSPEQKAIVFSGDGKLGPGQIHNVSEALSIVAWDEMFRYDMGTYFH